jgi:HEAT repeat protein
VAQLAKVVKSETDPKLRGKAIEAIGIAGGPAATEQLKALYSAEKDRAVRERILNAFMISGDAHSLVTLFRQEKDPQLKRKIVQVLSFMDDPESQALLEELLGAKS